MFMEWTVAVCLFSQQSDYHEHRLSELKEAFQTAYLFKQLLPPGFTDEGHVKTRVGPM